MYYFKCQNLTVGVHKRSLMALLLLFSDSCLIVVIPTCYIDRCKKVWCGRISRWISTLNQVCLSAEDECSKKMLKFILVVCGIVTSYEVSAHFYKVIGGLPTTIDKYPILAQLLLDVWGNQNYSQHCAGVIITNRHVITTAHCFQYSHNTGKNYSHPKYWKIRAGSSYRSKGGITYNLKKIIPHESFDSSFYTNDIAVVVVARNIVFNSRARQSTIIKPNVEVPPYALCSLVGWGATEPDGLQAEQLHHTAIMTIDNESCSASYSAIGAVIAESMLCAGPGTLDVGPVDGCFGDSGGPLIYKGLVVGLVSFGYSCGNQFYPGVYTKVSWYTNWIVKTVTTNKK